MVDGKTLIAQAIAKAEQRMILEQNQQIAEIFGLKVFAGPSVPNGEMHVYQDGKLALKVTNLGADA